MKKSNIANIVLYLFSSLSFLFVGCKDSNQNDTIKTKQIKLEEVFHLSHNPQSPSCNINIEFEYLDSSKDSVASIINSKLLEALLGKQYEYMNAKEAVDSFKNAYLTSYKNEVGKLYDEDIKNNPKEKNLLSWYNYQYELTNAISEGREGILNVKATTSEYTGGAHPNQWGKWMNFNEKSGALLTYNDIFLKNSEMVISKMLLDKLIEYISDKYKEEKVTNIEGLHSLGILSQSDMYISDNFILGKDEISFLYNNYDIAPYSVGSIVLSLPYPEIKEYMLH